MRKTRNITRVMAGALCAALLLGLLVTSFAGIAYAATLDTSRDCTVAFQLDEGQTGYETDSKALADYLKNTAGAKLSVDLYQVATAKSNGSYALTEHYSGTIALTGLEKLGPTTTAAQWEAYAAAAYSNLPATAAAHRDFVYADLSYGSEAVIDKLTPGMYLVRVADVNAGDTSFSFVPYLLAVPNWNADGTYNYDVVTGLKPMQRSNPAEIVITKYLPVCRQEIAGSTFVFEVKALNDAGEVVFNDVFSLVFDQHGSKSITVKNIPSGSTVYVTEVYSGSSYEVRDGDQRVVTATAGQTQTVEFWNDYNDNAPRNGASAVNHMEIDKTNGTVSLKWTKQASSAN